MKILFILGLPNPFPGAGWARIGSFAEFFSNKGYAVDVLGAFSYKSFGKRGQIKKGKVNILNVIFNMQMRHPLVFTINSFLSFMLSTLFLIARKPSIAIVSLPSGDVGLGAVLACRMTRVKYLIDYRDEWEDYAVSLASSEIKKVFYSIVKNFLTDIYIKSLLVIAVTPNFVDSLKHRGIANVRLVPNGADITLFKPIQDKNKKRVFTAFYSGIIGGYYRLDVVLNALRRLVDNGLRNVRLVIAGDGEIQRILNLAIELDISDKIDYIGSISEKTNLARLISESDVGLIPYDNNTLWKNSIPAKFFEYCASGLPVIATAYENSLISHLINDYKIGAVSPPLNEEKLAEAIFHLYKNESFREAAGKRARTLVEEKFDRNKIAEEFLYIVKRCL